MPKNYRKPPAYIVARLQTLPNQVIVATVKNISAAELSARQYDHLGLTGDKLGIASFPVVPALDLGRFSRYNVDGQTIVRRDLPKYEKAFAFTVPCFGDYTNMVTINQTRMVYPREILPAQNMAIQTEVLAIKIDGSCVVKFAITALLDQQAVDFSRNLLLALNVLHESVGGVGVFPLTTSPTEFLGYAHVSWDVLPPGTRDDRIALILAKFRTASSELRKRVADRYALFESLHPEQIIQGTYAMDGYLGAKMSDELVVFENMRDGNAVYILFANWREISQLTKTDLLRTLTSGQDYLRITHHDGWEARVREIVELHRRRAS